MHFHLSSVSLLQGFFSLMWYMSTIEMYLYHLIMTGTIFLSHGVIMRSPLSCCVCNTCYCFLVLFKLVRVVWYLMWCHRYFSKGCVCFSSTSWFLIGSDLMVDMEYNLWVYSIVCYWEWNMVSCTGGYIFF